MKILFLAILTHVIFAGEFVRFTQGTKKENIQAPMQVKLDRITLTIPKGWSVIGDGSDSLKGITATPTKNIETEETHFGIHFRNSPPKKSLEQLEATVMKDKAGRSSKYVSWNGQKWLLIEYKSENASKKPSIEWSGFFIKDNIQYILTAGTNISDENKFRSILFQHLRAF